MYNKNLNKNKRIWGQLSLFIIAISLLALTACNRNEATVNNPYAVNSNVGEYTAQQEQPDNTPNIADNTPNIADQPNNDIDEQTNTAEEQHSMTSEQQNADNEQTDDSDQQNADNEQGNNAAQSNNNAAQSNEAANPTPANVTPPAADENTAANETVETQTASNNPAQTETPTATNPPASVEAPTNNTTPTPATNERPAPTEAITVQTLGSSPGNTAVRQDDDPPGKLPFIHPDGTRQYIALPTKRLIATTDYMLLSEFADGARRIVEGRVFQSAGEAIVSLDFARLNNTAIGNTIEFHSFLPEVTEVIRLTVVGIYSDATPEWPSGIMMGTSMLNTRNEIITAYATLNNYPQFAPLLGQWPLTQMTRFTP